MDRTYSRLDRFGHQHSSEAHRRQTQMASCSAHRQPSGRTALDDDEIALIEFKPLQTPENVEKCISAILRKWKMIMELNQVSGSESVAKFNRLVFGPRSILFHLIWFKSVSNFFQIGLSCTQTDKETSEWSDWRRYSHFSPTSLADVTIAVYVEFEQQ